MQTTQKHAVILQECLLFGRALANAAGFRDAVTLPSRPPNARRLFAQENGFVAHADLDSLWKSLPPAERQAYEEKALAAKSDRKATVKTMRGALAAVEQTKLDEEDQV